MNDSKILIIGAKGQLGTALRHKYPDAKSVASNKLDITNKKSVDAFNWNGIKIILNAAAYTNVDGAETAEGRVAAWNVNATAVGHLIYPAWRNKMTIVHISTDYVFDGTKNPHSEDEQFSPLGVYGSSKAAGDLIVSGLDEHYILRTSWVIGEGKNFVRTLLELGKKGINPSVVSDQIGRLTFTSQLVSAIDHLLNKQCEFGTYNVSNDGQPASWADIAREIFKQANFSNTVTDVTTEKYYEGKQDIAPRPLQSTLDLTKIKATGLVLNDWKEDLAGYVQQELAT